MTDFITAMSRLEPRKRRRLAAAFFGVAAARPSDELLRSLSLELSIPAADFSFLEPSFFGLEVELDDVYAAAVASSRIKETTIYDDKSGMLESDGACLDAVFAYKRNNGTIELVLCFAKLNGKWAGRRFRRLSNRLRRTFGENGDAFRGIVPHFVALSPVRPGVEQTSSWPAWMRRADGRSFWLPFGKDPDEIAIIRCDRKGRPRRIGNYWKLSGGTEKGAVPEGPKIAR